MYDKHRPIERIAYKNPTIDISIFLMMRNI